MRKEYSLISLSPFQFLMLAVSCLATACSGTEADKRPPGRVGMARFESFGEAARFSLPNTESWWFVLPTDESDRIDGARRILLCGSDFTWSKGARGNTFNMVCIWDYEGSTPPDAWSVDGASIPRTVGAASWLGKSLLEASGMHEKAKYRKVVDGRFVVGASSEIVLQKALERGGVGWFLGSAAISDSPEGAQEVVLRRPISGKETCIAHYPSRRSVAYLSAFSQEGSKANGPDPLFVVGQWVEGSPMRNGWIEYMMPEHAKAEELVSELRLMTMVSWGVGF